MIGPRSTVIHMLAKADEWGGKGGVGEVGGGGGGVGGGGGGGGGGYCTAPR